MHIGETKKQLVEEGSLWRTVEPSPEEEKEILAANF